MQHGTANVLDSECQSTKFFKIFLHSYISLERLWSSEVCILGEHFSWEIVRGRPR